MDACEAACESLDACFAWTARPTTKNGAANLSCDVVGGIVPLLTATRVGCDWGRNLDFDPSLSTSGVKAKGWATLAVDRSKSRDTDGGYGKHPYVALVPVLDDGQNASLRVLADRSIVEAFAFGQAMGLPQLIASLGMFMLIQGHTMRCNLTLFGPLDPDHPVAFI